MFRRSVRERIENLRASLWVASAIAAPIIAAVVITQLNRPDLAGEVVYTVERGDSLTRIARRHDVSVQALIDANGLTNPDLIYAGQSLTIPTVIQETRLHTVRRGESLAQIAGRYGTDAATLVDLNRLAGVNDIRAGQQIAVPLGVGGPTAALADNAYTLKRGDSLYKVSLIYGVPVEDILAENSLSGPNAIYPGLEIRIPGSPAARQALTHTIRVGDTLHAIAYEYDTSVDTLMAANGLRSTRIYAGQTLAIPQAGAPARAQPAQTATRHTVEASDTLGGIALQYNVTVHSLAVANGLSSPSQIYPGLELSIPAVEAGSSSVQYAAEGRCEEQATGRTGTGYFIIPSQDYVVTRGYFASHTAIDLAAPLGTPVYAADGGTVVYSGWNNYGYGNLIVLDHGNGWRTYYAHLSRVYVGCGQWAARGSTIGEVGSTGNSTGPHLHFELLRFGIAIDPQGYIRF